MRAPFAVLLVFLCSPGAQAVTWGADYFPNVALTTQDGKVVHFYDDLLKGKAVAVDLIYTRCTASCPLETAKLAQVQRLLGDRVGKDVFFYSISIDPRHDTPEVLKAYAEKFHAGPGWLFLTGDEDDIKLVGRKLGLSSLTDAVNRDGHQPSLMIGNEATGEWMRNSALDNARFLATTITNFLHKWKSTAPAQSYAEAHRAPSAGKFEYLFRSRCAACHTIGGGTALGPDLAGVTQRRDRVWLARYLAQPERLREQGDPIATSLSRRFGNVRMPDLGLTSEDIAGLIDYVDKQGQAAAPVRNPATP